MNIRLVGTLLIFFAVAVPGFAHHSYIHIDRTTVIAFEATVLDFQWRNPHVYLRIGVEENGESVEWEIETGSTPILIHSGWSKDSLKLGDIINIRVHPEHDTDRRYALLESLTTTAGIVLRQGHKTIAVVGHYGRHQRRLEVTPGTQRTVRSGERLLRRVCYPSIDRRWPGIY